MKKRYKKPLLESYRYSPEEGYASTVALYKDYILIEGNDRTTLRAADEVSVYTDATGEWSTGEWE
jgi:hypothetical protein